MEIASFIAKCMMRGYEYEQAWDILNKAIDKGLFNFSLTEDESRFSYVLDSVLESL